MSKSFSRLFMAILLAVAPVSTTIAGTIYVSKEGKDSNSGTQNRPFLTIQRGLEAAQPGDRVLVGPGVYAEEVNTMRDGTDGNKIVIDGQNQASVTRLSLSHAHHQVQNIQISGFDRLTGGLIWLKRGAHYTVLTNMVVDAAGIKDVTGIFWEAPNNKPFGTDAASNCLIISNRITGIVTRNAFSIMGDNNLIVGNYIHDLAQSDFVRLWGRNNIIRGNTFTNNFAVEGLGYHIDFIQTFGNNGYGSRGHIIEQNTVIKVDGQLTQLESTLLPGIRDWTFRNNVFVDVRLQASCTMPDVKYYNNVFVRCNTGGGHALNFGSRTYDGGTSSAHGAQVFNNVFLDCGGDRDRGHYGISSDLSDVAADYNFVAKNGYQPVRKGDNPVGHPDGWNSLRFFEENGINGGNPLFLSEYENDFRLLPGSPLIGSGVPIKGITNDLAGLLRRNAIGEWDMGAHVFSDSFPRPAPPANFRVIVQ